MYVSLPVGQWRVDLGSPCAVVIVVITIIIIVIIIMALALSFASVSLVGVIFWCVGICSCACVFLVDGFGSQGVDRWLKTTGVMNDKGTSR